jgi:hypothetical protein
LRGKEKENEKEKEKEKLFELSHNSPFSKFRKSILSMPTS